MSPEQPDGKSRRELKQRYTLARVFAGAERHVESTPGEEKENFFTLMLPRQLESVRVQD